MDAPLSPEFQSLHGSLLLISLFMGLQVEHLHDTIVGVVAVVSEELLDKNLEPFEACSCLKDIDGCTQDIDSDVNHSATWEEAAGVVDKMALC